jgi:hypothetical protein
LDFLEELIDLGIVALPEAFDFLFGSVLDGFRAGFQGLLQKREHRQEECNSTQHHRGDWRLKEFHAR